MDRLKKVGTIVPKSSKDVKISRIGLGFEKLDRDVFDPENAYDPVCELGVKWVRIQSGWARTETEKGVYHFEWLDSIVDNLFKRGLKPWICLCYGNGLYDENAAKVFGSVGYAPIFNDEQKKAWENYVKALVLRYKGKVDHYEVWNEPDGLWCWKSGVSGTELGLFTKDTAKYVKEVFPEAKVIGGVICRRNLGFINEALAAGMAEYIDFISFHEYTHDERNVFERVDALRELAHVYNPNIRIIQGESGSQSRRGGNGALKLGAWTEERQAKQLARHACADLLSDVYFTSFFSCMDMMEALNGTVGDKASYLDYGYFGVLGAQFNDDGRATGTYTKKKSFYVLQNLASIFAEDATVTKLPLISLSEMSDGIYEYDLARFDITSGCFTRDTGDAFCYWYPSNIMTTSYEGTFSLDVYTKYEKIQLVDVMDGSIYEIPDNMISRDDFGVVHIDHLPVKDTPMMLTFGDFIK